MVLYLGNGLFIDHLQRYGRWVSYRLVHSKLALKDFMHLLIEWCER
jgi:hypothetical protein